MNTISSLLNFIGNFIDKQTRAITIDTNRVNINAVPFHVGGRKIITVQTFDKDDITINANGYNESNINIAKDGYTPIGVLDTYINNASSSGSGSSFVFPYRSYISGNTYYFGIRNTNSNQSKVRIYAKILYVSSTQGT